MNQRNKYELELEQNEVNHVALSPLSFIRRTAEVFLEHVAVIHGDTRRTWGETYARCRQLASALEARGVARGDTVAVMVPNVPALLEAQVEGVLYRHPAVLEAVVVARPDEKWGETPCAFVTFKPGASVSEAELIEFCRANMANFKCPRHVFFSDLPKTSTGKIQKFVLRERALSL